MGLTTVKDSSDPSIAVDDTGTSGSVQVVKIGVGAAGSLAGIIGTDPTAGIPVYVTSLQGTYTSGAAIDLLTAKPALIGVRASDTPPGPVDNPDDATFVWGSPSGDLNTLVRVDGGLLDATTVQPNAGSSYTAGDVIGNVLQFSGAALANGRGGSIVGARCIDKTGSAKVDIYLELYDASPTGAPADNAAVTGLTAANEIAAHPLVATIEFKAANYIRNKCYGTVLGGALPPMDYHPTGTTLYGIAYFPGTAKTGTIADGSFWFGLDTQFN